MIVAGGTRNKALIRQLAIGPGIRSTDSSLIRSLPQHRCTGRGVDLRAGVSDVAVDDAIERNLGGCLAGELIGVIQMTGQAGGFIETDRRSALTIADRAIKRRTTRQSNSPRRC